MLPNDKRYSKVVYYVIDRKQVVLLLVREIR